MASILAATTALKNGGIIAYPTEAVFGLGCDPNNEAAVMQLLAIKQRPVNKGLIVIASHISQLEPYIKMDTLKQFPDVLASWPGPHTWLLPCKADTPTWLRGQHKTLAIRVTAHATAAALCDAFKNTIVSTSANISDQAPAKTFEETQKIFGGKIDLIIPGDTDDMEHVTTIRDACSGQQLR